MNLPHEHVRGCMGVPTHLTYIQYTGDVNEIAELFLLTNFKVTQGLDESKRANGHVYANTPSGQVEVFKNDFVVMGFDQDIMVFRPGVFFRLFEAAPL